MKLQDFKLEHIIGVLDIWKSVGGLVPRYVSPEKIQGALQRAQEGDIGACRVIHDGYRIGSKFGDSKLRFLINSSKGTLEEIKFNSNIYPHSSKSLEKAAYATEDEFSKKVSAYLGEIERGIWKSLTAENLERAQCIFVSKGFDYPDIKDVSYLEKTRGEAWIRDYAKQAVKEIKDGQREYEFIFSVLGSNRCRMYVYPESDPQARERFPGAEFMLRVTHMNHIDGPTQAVEARFSRIEKALLAERFPALKF